MFNRAKENMFAKTRCKMQLLHIFKENTQGIQ